MPEKYDDMPADEQAIYIVEANIYLEKDMNEWPIDILKRIEDIE